MHDAQKKVHQFYEKMECPTAPAEPAIRDAQLSARLLLEEALETVVGLVGRDGALSLMQDFALKVHDGPDAAPDLVEVVDGLCDTIYVAYGRAEAVGIDLEPYFNAVHAANMQKEARVIDGHGKRGFKPADWVDPKHEIRKMLETEQGHWRYRWEWRYRR